MDLCVDDVNGYLVETDEELTEKLDQLISDDEKLKRFSTESFEISKRFSAHNFVEKAEKLYARVIDLYSNGLEFEE